MPQTPPLDDDFPEPPRIRRLRLLVTLLIVVLIGAVLIVVGTLVIKIGEIGATGGSTERAAEKTEVTAESVSLPEGAEVIAVGEGQGALLIAIRGADGGESLLRFDASSGALLSETALDRN